MKVAKQIKKLEKKKKVADYGKKRKKQVVKHGKKVMKHKKI